VFGVTADGHIGTCAMLAIAEHCETDQRALVEAYVDARRSYLPASPIFTPSAGDGSTGATVWKRVQTP
jgi:hypothetical protein